MRSHAPFHPGHGHPLPPLHEHAIGPDTPQPYRVFYALREVSRVSKHLMSKRLAEKDAHLGQAFVLRLLAAHEGMSQSDLARVLCVARPTVTVMLGKMERAGLIERRVDDHDHRLVRTYLTESGRELQAQLEAVHAAVIEETIAPLSERDQRELERLLRLVIDNSSAALERA